jgi:hypothetical protein
MTTGCTCSTPGCPGIAPERDSQCPRCEIEATDTRPARGMRQIIHRVLDGPADRWYTLVGDREAGS